MVPGQLFPLHPYRLTKPAATPFHRLSRWLPEPAQELKYLRFVLELFLRPLRGAIHSFFFFVSRKFRIAFQKALHVVRAAQYLR